MSNKICGIVGESITFATGDLVRCFNVPYGATGVEVRGAALANDGWNFCPKLQAAFWEDAGTWKDQTDYVRERGTTQFAEIDSFDAQDDNFYIGCAVPFRGFYVNVKNANGTAATMTVNYRKSDSTWADTSATDSTASAGATLAIDNKVTWTVPTDWIKAKLSSVASPAGGPSQDLYWVQIAVSADLDTDVQIAEIIPLPVQPSVSSGVGGADTPVLVATAVTPPRYWFDPAHVGGIEITAANTEVVRVEWLITSPVTVLYAQ